MTLQKHHGDALQSRECDNCPIKYRAFCSHCDPEEIARLESIKRYRTYRSGETVVLEGHEMPFMASVVAGLASLSRGLEDGRTQMVGLLLPSDFIGNPGRQIAVHTVSAMEELTLCCFDRRDFGRLVDEMPHVAQRMLQMKLDELDAAREWLLLLGRKTARERVASLLAMIARRDATAHARHCEGRIEVDLLLTRAAIADFLGLTLETVSRQMSALKLDGVLEFGAGRKVVIRDYQTLYALTSDDSDGGVIV